MYVHQDYQKIILPLPIKAQAAINDLKNNQNYPTIDIESVMSFIVDGLKESNGVFDNEEDLVETFTEATTMLRSELRLTDQLTAIESFKTLVQSIHLLLNEYGVFIYAEFPYEFERFIQGRAIILRMA